MEWNEVESRVLHDEFTERLQFPPRVETLEIAYKQALVISWRPQGSRFVHEEPDNGREFNNPKKYVNPKSKFGRLASDVRTNVIPENVILLFGASVTSLTKVAERFQQNVGTFQFLLQVLELF